MAGNLEKRPDVVRKFVFVILLLCCQIPSISIEGHGLGQVHSPTPGALFALRIFHCRLEPGLPTASARGPEASAGAVWCTECSECPADGTGVSVVAVSRWHLVWPPPTGQVPCVGSLSTKVGRCPHIMSGKYIVPSRPGKAHTTTRYELFLLSFSLSASRQLAETPAQKQTEQKKKARTRVVDSDSRQERHFVC